MGLKDKLILMISEIVDKKIDAKAAARELDKQLDEKLPGASERLQRGVITSILCELLEGLWEEDMEAWEFYLRQRYHL